MHRSLAVALLAASLLIAACGSSDGSATTDAAPSSTTDTVGTDTAAMADSGAVAGSTTPPTAPTTAAAAGAVEKDVLAREVDPPGADGRTLTLIRYTIPPGAKLAAHIHPGVQLASIESGTLSYTIVSGTVVVTHTDGSTEQLTGPTDTKLGPGDEVEEKGDMVHFGANDTDQPVVILATLLTEDGKDLAVTVPQPAN